MRAKGNVDVRTNDPSAIYGEDRFIRDRIYERRIFSSIDPLVPKTISSAWCDWLVSGRLDAGVRSQDGPISCTITDEDLRTWGPMTFTRMRECQNSPERNVGVVVSRKSWASKCSETNRFRPPESKWTEYRFDLQIIPTYWSLLMPIPVRPMTATPQFKKFNTVCGAMKLRRSSIVEEGIKHNQIVCATRSPLSQLNGSRVAFS